MSPWMNGAISCATCAAGLRVIELEDRSPGREAGDHTAAVPQGYISLERQTRHT